MAKFEDEDCIEVDAMDSFPQVELKFGSTRYVTNEIKTILRSDEKMMRLLSYLPLDYERAIPDPLDFNRIPKCLVRDGSAKYKQNCERDTGCVGYPFTEEEVEEYWLLADDRIFTKEKSVDIEEEVLCRIYIYTGRRRPIFANDHLVHQELIISVFVHDSYSTDDRVQRIDDRLVHLLALRDLDGVIGKLNYKAGNSRHAPIGYRHQEHAFIYTTRKEGYSE